MAEEQIKKLSLADFKSNQEVRWCPGCGDHAILNAVQKAMAASGIERENFAVISGIGCSSRFPYYMNTYGIHGIHGRAAAIASGTKCANPKLKIIQISGDGDALAIGGNHFIHLVRRNIDLTMILFNNEIYGLTKGQYSPTTKLGMKTKTSPHGTIEHPFHPGELVLGAQGKFFARSIDTNIRLTQKILQQGFEHKGTKIVEILQNCVIYNDKTHALVTDKKNKDENQLHLEHGKPMVFGKNKDKGLVLDGFGFKVVKIGENNVTIDDICIHDETEEKPFIHLMLANMAPPDFPVALGVIRAVKAHSYEDELEAQIAEAQENSNIKCMNDLLNSGNTWLVE
ncbi:MAG: 2-oxoacid:ferredoxin oxidoreductase subunit beta [Bacteroidia bacterium]|nr:MAG: 2-oxoacid:ferredoxin oxidoreductase subunit beta [Bacteroidia bacterium]PIE86215.1 MAG: 2-oxoacid:ferredoxin oxidoreductase subunit beta [Bacteroidia bacterium]